MQSVFQLPARTLQFTGSEVGIHCELACLRMIFMDRDVRFDSRFSCEIASLPFQTALLPAQLGGVGELFLRRFEPHNIRRDHTREQRNGHEREPVQEPNHASTSAGALFLRLRRLRNTFDSRFRARNTRTLARLREISNRLARSRQLSRPR